MGEFVWAALPEDLRVQQTILHADHQVGRGFFICSVLTQGRHERPRSKGLTSSIRQVWWNRGTERAELMWRLQSQTVAYDDCTNFMWSWGCRRGAECQQLIKILKPSEKCSSNLVEAFLENSKRSRDWDSEIRFWELVVENSKLFAGTSQDTDLCGLILCLPSPLSKWATQCTRSQGAVWGVWAAPVRAWLCPLLHMVYWIFHNSYIPQLF